MSYIGYKKFVYLQRMEHNLMPNINLAHTNQQRYNQAVIF